jgi:hypothetical protein
MLPAHEEILSIQLVTNNKYARQVRSCAAGLMCLKYDIDSWNTLFKSLTSLSYYSLRILPLTALLLYLSIYYCISLVRPTVNCKDLILACLDCAIVINHAWVYFVMIIAYKSIFHGSFRKIHALGLI